MFQYMNELCGEDSDGHLAFKILSCISINLLALGNMSDAVL